MPKKTRKMKQRAAMRRSLPTSPVEEQVMQEEASAEQEAPMRMRPTVPSTSRGLSPLTFDYSHIYSDLRRIAFFAIFFFAVLVVLSFVIR